MPNSIYEKKTNVLFLICTGIILASCNSQTAPIPVSTNEATRTELPLLSPQSKTPFLTSTTVSTTTPESTITLTPPSTLSPQLSDTTIRQLLQNDVDCKPPCFLGIIPEQTSLGELKNIFHRFSLPNSIGNDDIAFISRYYKSEIPPDTVFYIENDMVKSIHVFIAYSNNFEWSIYSPVALLNRFGTPSKVVVGLQTPHESDVTLSKGWYAVTIFYDKLDLIIQYGYPEVKLGNSITICPNSDKFDGAEIWLGKSPHNPPSGDGSLETVTPYTLENFRDKILLDTNTCFTLRQEQFQHFEIAK